MRTIHLLLAILLVSSAANAQNKGNNNKRTVTMESVKDETQKNKEALRKLYEEGLNKRNMDVVKELISDEYIGVNGEKGVKGFQAPFLLLNAFPDAQWKVENIIGDGNKVVVQWKFQGTHTGQFQHIAATGKTTSSDGMAIYAFKQGRVIGTQVITDRLTFLQQLGELPVDLTLLPGKPAAEEAIFIDKFMIPAAASKEFHERMTINRSFIKKLPGFISDAAYEYTDANGSIICVTVARWKNREALASAKEAVQAEYREQGFDPAEMFKRLNITADRGIYTAVQR